MIIDFTTPFPKKYVYKNPTQREPWGSWMIPKILCDYSQESLGEHFFPKRKNETDTKPDILDREALP